MGFGAGKEAGDAVIITTLLGRQSGLISKPTPVLTSWREQPRPAKLRSRRLAATTEASAIFPSTSGTEQAAGPPRSC
jgi:hypothetical protein